MVESECDAWDINLDLFWCGNKEISLETMCSDNNTAGYMIIDTKKFIQNIVTIHYWFTSKKKES